MLLADHSVYSADPHLQAICCGVSDATYYNVSDTTMYQIILLDSMCSSTIRSRILSHDIIQSFVTSTVPMYRTHGPLILTYLPDKATNIQRVKA